MRTKRTTEPNYEEKWRQQWLQNLTILGERDRAQKQLDTVKRKVAELLVVVRSSACATDPELCAVIDQAAADIGLTG